jgi:cytochrome c-type biogenesis protein CcmH
VRGCDAEELERRHCYERVQTSSGIPLSRSPLATTLSHRERVFTPFLLALFLLLPLAAHAVTPGERLADPALEARARAIASELRCLVCQNQSIDDSDASLAKDLRVLVREKLKEGMSDAQVREFVHSRYGDFVLLRPPMKPGTLLLWSAPLIALLAGAAAVWMAARRRAGFPATPAKALSEEERARLKTLGVSNLETPKETPNS